MPTQIQSLKAVILCQLLSNSFQPKYLDKNKRYCEVSGGAGSKGSRERDYSLFTFLKTLHFIYVRLLIYVFRYDNKYKTISIQAGASESIAVIINADVKWEFV